MTQPETSPGTISTSRSPRRRATIFVIVLAWLFVLMPFLFWHGTWFGRPLSDQEIENYLSDTQRPRKTQHALSQLADRILRGDNSAKRWYAQVERLAAHPQAELRMTVAWVMGQDNREEAFHTALLRLLADPEPLVRRNAALSLVRFGDASGRSELAAMLRPYTIRAARAGSVSVRLKENDTVNPGTLVARIQTRTGEPYEVRAPLPGRLEAKLVADGTNLVSGDAIVRLSPAPEQVWEALRGLYLVGWPEDLPDIEPFARALPDMPEKIQQQAVLTIEAIRSRAAKSGGIEDKTGRD